MLWFIQFVHEKKGKEVFQDSNQEKSGIEIFYSDEADTREINNLLTKDYFGGSRDPIGEDRKLILPLGGYASGFGGLTFWCYRLPSTDEDLYQTPANPFFAGYRSVVYVKDLDGETLWQNRDYNEDGTRKEDDESQ